VTAHPDARRRSEMAARAAADKKGADTVILDVSDIISVAETFVITSGANARQVRTIAEEIEEQLKRHCDAAPTQVEGLSDASWVLLDYGDVVVHVFLAQTRAYYDLDRLWSDAPHVPWTADGEAAATI
jgi:ribosome-associated protein